MARKSRLAAADIMASPGLLSPSRAAADDSMSMLMDTSLPLQTRARARANKVASSLQLSPRKDIDALDDEQLEELAWKTMMNGEATWGKQARADGNETLQASGSSVTPPRALPLQVVASPNVEVRRRKTPRNSVHSSSDLSSSAALQPLSGPSSSSSSSSRRPLKESREERRQRLGLSGAVDEEQKQEGQSHQEEADTQEQTLRGGPNLKDSITQARPPSSPSKRTLPSMLPFSPYHKKQRPQTEALLPPSSSSSPFGAERRSVERPSELVKLLGKGKSTTPAGHNEEEKPATPPPAKVSWLKRGGRLPPRGLDDVDVKQRPFRAVRGGEKVRQEEVKQEVEERKEKEEGEESTPRAVMPSEKEKIATGQPKVSSARRERTSSRRPQADIAPVKSVPAPALAPATPPSHAVAIDEEMAAAASMPLAPQDEATPTTLISETPALTGGTPLAREAATPPLVHEDVPIERLPTTSLEDVEPQLVEERKASTPAAKKSSRERTSVAADAKKGQVKKQTTAPPSRLAQQSPLASTALASHLAPPPALPPLAAGSTSRRLTRVSRTPSTAQQASVEVPLGFRKTSTGNLVPLPPSSEPSAYVPASEHFAKLLAQAEEEEKRLRSRSEALRAHAVPEYLAKRREEIEQESAEMLKREVELMREKELRSLDGRAGLAGKKHLPSGLLGARPPPTSKAQPTKAQPFVSSLETRRLERRAYESKRAARDALLEEERAKVREEKRRLELEEVKRERERRIPKANPVPEFIYGGTVKRVEMAQARGATGSGAGASAGGSGAGKRKR